MNHLAWRKVVPSLVYRVSVHHARLAVGVAHHPMADDADLSPRGVARIIREFIDDS